MSKRELGDGEPSPEIRHYTCEFVDTKDDPPIMTEEPYDGALEGEWRKFICPICHERVILLFKAGWERKIRPLREAADKAARTLGENLSANSGAMGDTRELKAALKALVDKLKVILPEVDGIIGLQSMRAGHGIYKGPSIAEELKEAERLLG